MGIATDPPPPPSTPNPSLSPPPHLPLHPPFLSVVYVSVIEEWGQENLKALLTFMCLKKKRITRCRSTLVYIAFCAELNTLSCCSWLCLYKKYAHCKMYIRWNYKFQERGTGSASVICLVFVVVCLVFLLHGFFSLKQVEEGGGGGETNLWCEHAFLAEW